MIVIIIDYNIVLKILFSCSEIAECQQTIDELGELIQRRVEFFTSSEWSEHGIYRHMIKSCTRRRIQRWSPHYCSTQSHGRVAASYRQPEIASRAIYCQHQQLLPACRRHCIHAHQANRFSPASSHFGHATSGFVFVVCVLCVFAMNLLE